jgi:leader peptidase (prepilin peptidase)/N-methyltransferase
MGYTSWWLALFSYAFVAVLGLIIGSFLNVVIYRIPRDQSIIKPPSHCPTCNTKLKWYDNIPILSYLLLKGKCRYCGAKISIKYPLIEILTALSFILVFQQYGFSLNSLKWIIFACLLTSTGLIDFFEGVVPDIIVIPGLTLGIAFSLFYGMTVFLQSLYGMLLMAGFFLIIILLTKGGMGWGDLTFGAMIGSFLGFQFSLLTLFMAFIIGAVTGLVVIITKKKGRKDTMPFGPFLSIAAFISSIYGLAILRIYFTFFNFFLK